MIIEQKKLLLEIAEFHIKDFMLEMNDHWSSSDYAKSREYAAKIRSLEADYKQLYGDLPKWGYIDDVIEYRDNLKKELLKMTECRIPKITCADDIYNNRLFIEKNFKNWYTLQRNKKRENYIWDEDKTIRQNKELTAQHNAAIDAEIEKCKNEYHTMVALLNKRIYEYIIDNCNVKCSEKQAEIIWNYCETQHEDEPYNCIDDVIELFEKLKEADK